MVDRNANTRFSESEKIAPIRYKTSNSPAKNSLDLRRWLWRRTFKGCQHVRCEGMRTYDQAVPGRTYKLLIWVYDLWFIVQGEGTLPGRMATAPQEVHACNVLADDVELDVDERAGVDVVEIGVLCS